MTFFSFLSTVTSTSRWQTLKMVDEGTRDHKGDTSLPKMHLTSVRKLISWRYLELVLTASCVLRSGLRELLYSSELPCMHGYLSLPDLPSYMLLLGSPRQLIFRHFSEISKKILLPEMVNPGNPRVNGMLLCPSDYFKTIDWVTKMYIALIH